MDLSSESSDVSSPEYLGDSCSDEEYRPQQTLCRSGTSRRKISKRSRGLTRSKSLRGQRHSSTIILEWLDQNYVVVADSCLPRCVVYAHYQDFCKTNSIETLSAASFGKIVRVKFPDLSTRRLGTRGKSKYHYFGLAVKETSIYFKSNYKRKGITRFTNYSNRNESATTTRSGSALPPFPSVNDIKLAHSFPTENLQTFLLMYRAHCQRFLDSIIRGNYGEIQEFLVHFWKGMPSHMLPILNCQVTLDIITVCDSILYKAICESIVFASLQVISESCINELYGFTSNLIDWLFQSLCDFPPSLTITKVQAAECFGRSLRRQLHLTQLAKEARNALVTSDFIKSIYSDLRKVDFILLRNSARSICLKNTHGIGCALLDDFNVELQQLLIKQSNIEDYFQWLDSLLEREMNKIDNDSDSEKLDICNDFVMLWNLFVSHLDRQLCSIGAKSRDAFKTLLELLSEYGNYLVEFIQSQLMKDQYMKLLKTQNDDTVSPKNEFNIKPLGSTTAIASVKPSPALVYSTQPHFLSTEVTLDEKEYCSLHEATITEDVNVTCGNIEPESQLHTKLEQGSESFYRTKLETFDLIPDTHSSINISSFPDGSIVNSPLLLTGTFDTEMGPLTHSEPYSNHFNHFLHFDFDSGIDFGSGDDFSSFDSSPSSLSSFPNHELLGTQLLSTSDFQFLDFMEENEQLLIDPFNNSLTDVHMPF